MNSFYKRGVASLYGNVLSTYRTDVISGVTYHTIDCASDDDLSVIAEYLGLSDDILEQWRESEPPHRSATAYSTLEEFIEAAQEDAPADSQALPFQINCTLPSTPEGLRDAIKKLNVRQGKGGLAQQKKQ